MEELLELGGLFLWAVIIIIFSLLEQSRKKKKQKEKPSEIPQRSLWDTIVEEVKKSQGFPEEMPEPVSEKEMGAEEGYQEPVGSAQEVYEKPVSQEIVRDIDQELLPKEETPVLIGRKYEAARVQHLLNVGQLNQGILWKEILSQPLCKRKNRLRGLGKYAS